METGSRHREPGACFETCEAQGLDCRVFWYRVEGPPQTQRAHVCGQNIARPLLQSYLNSWTSSACIIPGFGAVRETRPLARDDMVQDHMQRSASKIEARLCFCLDDLQDSTELRSLQCFNLSNSSREIWVETCCATYGFAVVLLALALHFAHRTPNLFASVHAEVSVMERLTSHPP